MPSLSWSTWALEGHIPPMCPFEWTEAAVGGHSLSGETGTVERLSHHHNDTRRLKDTLLQRGQSVVTSFSSEPLFPIASDCKTFLLCTTVHTICEMSRIVSDLIRERRNVFIFSTCLLGFDCTHPLFVLSLHLNYRCGRISWCLLSICVLVELYNSMQEGSLYFPSILCHLDH